MPSRTFSRFCLAVCMISVILSYVTVLHGAENQTVANKTYDAWISPSFSPAPYAPFHECLTFSANTLTIASCPAVNSGPFMEVPILGVASMTIWIASVPCGTANLFLVGTSFDGAADPDGANVMGGIIIGREAGWTFGVEGVQNQSCTIGSPTSRNRYTK